MSGERKGYVVNRNKLGKGQKGCGERERLSDGQESRF